MELFGLTESLDDKRCGLFFLAGLDGEGTAGGATLTIHSAEGTLTQEQRNFITETMGVLEARPRVRFCHHSLGDLYAPDTLEGFAGLFGHDRIVADPTGAFARVSKLLRLAGLIRAELGRSVGPILWQPHASKLVVVAKSQEDAARTRLDEAVRALVDQLGCDDLKRTIRAVAVGTTVPEHRYIPVDAASHRSLQRTPGFARLLARVSGIAALIGTGTLSAAQARVPVPHVDEQSLMPGISALADLTTLGENSYGVRNHYQAIGGLRLYFGETGMVKQSVFHTVAFDAEGASHLIRPTSDRTAELGALRPETLSTATDGQGRTIGRANEGASDGRSRIYRLPRIPNPDGSGLPGSGR